MDAGWMDGWMRATRGLAYLLACLGREGLKLVKGQRGMELTVTGVLKFKGI